MEARYDPQRVQDLSRRTSEAINSLSRLSSGDPSATDALRTVRLARQNLEDHWMVALRDISGSNAMVSWRSSQLTALRSGRSSSHNDNLPDHLSATKPAIPISDLRRAELLGAIDFLERKALGGGDGSGTPTASDLDRQQQLDALASQVALWVRNDPSFAAELVELSATNMTVAELLGHAAFPSSFASDVVRRMAVPNGPETNVDPDRYAASLSIALGSLVDDPAACLDLLLDGSTVYALASLESLDPTKLSDFVVSGLYDAVSDDPDRLADGYKVLQLLTAATNGPLDGGMSSGMALGVASSLIGYVETLAPALNTEGSTEVVIRAVEPSLELGTYDDLVDLFGALFRVPEAQVALGTMLTAYTFEVFDDIGGNALTSNEVVYVARFTDLIGDAGRSERAELLMVSAAEEARSRQNAGLVGFGLNFVLMAGGVGSVARSLTSQALKIASNSTTRTDRDDLPDNQIAAHSYHLMTVAAVSVLASNPSTRSNAGVSAVTSAQWAEATRLIDVVDQEDDVSKRMIAVGDLDHWIETSVPQLAVYLLELRSMPGMDELTEGRNAVDPD